MARIGHEPVAEKRQRGEHVGPRDDDYREVASVDGHRGDEDFDPLSALDRLPRTGRALVASTFLIGCVFATLVGLAILSGTIHERRELRTVVFAGFGGGMLVVALVAGLAWLRISFGPRRWLDRLIGRLCTRRVVYYFWIAGLAYLLAAIGITVM